MNRTFYKSSSMLYPFPPNTDLGYMNDSGIIYIICDEIFYEPNISTEQPISNTVMISGFCIIIFLVVVIICAIAKTKRNKYSNII